MICILAMCFCSPFGPRVFRHLTLCLVGFIPCVSAHPQLIDGGWPRGLCCSNTSITISCEVAVTRVLHEVGVPHSRCACVLESDDITSIGDEGGIL